MKKPDVCGWRRLARKFYEQGWGLRISDEDIEHKFQGNISSESHVQLMMVQTLAAMDMNLASLSTNMSRLCADVDRIERRVNRVLRTKEEKKHDAFVERRRQRIIEYMDALEEKYGRAPVAVSRALIRQIGKTYSEGVEMSHVPPCGPTTKTRARYDEWIGEPAGAENGAPADPPPETG